MNLPCDADTMPLAGGNSSELQYASNINRNPRGFFGTWTPDGWRSQRIFRGKTVSESLAFSGDGQTTKFSGLPGDFEESVHDVSDKSTDGGIYPAVPRVEYPPGNPRWAVSHTFLAYPVADQSLYEQQYVWDREEGALHTYFRRYVPLEEAVTDPRDGLTVRVQEGPISTVVAGNRSYGLCNSAIRGVWDNPEKRGRNYYCRDQVRLCCSHNAVYVIVRECPVVQCFGIWKARPADQPAFDQEGACMDQNRLVDGGVPLDCPKLGTVGYALERVSSRFYEGSVEVVAADCVRIEPPMLKVLQACRDVPFAENRVGYAAWRSWDHDGHVGGVPGHYACHWDFNANGVVDADDEQILLANIGREVRVNYYSAAYFGNDWLSAGVLLNPEMHREPVICSWRQGAGYDPMTGVIRLFETPGPGRPVYVEYYHDAPAGPGTGNIVVNLRRLAREG